MKLSELPLNPFEDDIVFEPRQAEQPVIGLNDRPIDLLLKQFGRLETEPPPRRQPLRLKAQLVTSAEPGYGKSHLIGRLFRALRERATLVYLRPFRDSAGSWRSILLRVVQELNRSTDGQPSAGRAEKPTQFDALACGVVAHLLAGMIARGKVAGDDAEELAAALRSDSLKVFGREEPEHYLRAWVRDGFDGQLRDPLVGELRRSGIELNAPAAAWLKVFHAYAFRTGDKDSEDRRAACLEWLKGEGISEGERTRIGLESAELPPIEESALKRNISAHERLEDLLALAGFYRPFLFCFDQTELFTISPELSAEFGAVIDQLVSFGLNHLIVVTANLEPWTGVIVKNFQTAYRDRFSDPLQLEGITPPQAAALARQRLTGGGLAEAEIDRFCEAKWLAAVFRDVPAHSVRTFLRLCAKRCAALSQGRAAVKPAKTLAESYGHYEAEVRARPNQLDFEPDTLLWSIEQETVGSALAGVTVEHFQDQSPYFPIAWKTDARVLLLGLEDSSNATRWRSILGAATRQATQHKDQRMEARALFLRTPGQSRIPGLGWAVIGREIETARDYFTIYVIAPEDLLTIYACFELYANVVEGNAPFGREEMLSFVREKLKPWWQRLLERPHPAPQL